MENSQKKRQGGVSQDIRRFVILSKLDDIGQPMNMLEIGFTASPQIIRNMAARGMVKVTVEISARGREILARERLKRQRAASIKQMQARGALRAIGG